MVIRGSCEGWRGSPFPELADRLCAPLGSLVASISRCPSHSFLPFGHILDQKSPGSSPGGAIGEGPAADQAVGLSFVTVARLSRATRRRQFSGMIPPATALPATDSVRDQVLSALRENRVRLGEMYGVRDLLVFGSVARGEATPSSDVDLVVEFDSDRITLPTFLDFADDVEALLGRRVDVVSLKKLAPRLRAQVEAEAVRVA